MNSYEYIERLKNDLQTALDICNARQKEIVRLNNIINELEKYIIDEENENNKLLISKITSPSGKEKIGIENVIYDDILDKLQELKEGK